MLVSLLTFAAAAGHHAMANFILIVICALVGAYLFAALLWPEKF
jgi:K+-transporting ATPase KdpF subunit